MGNLSGIAAILFLGAGLVGSYRALIKKSNLLTKWHAFVFLGVPVTTYLYIIADYKIDEIFIAPLIIVFYINWLISGIQVFCATRDKPEPINPKEYLQRLCR